MTDIQTNPNTGYASASLYVGDLALDVTEALLFDVFNAVGSVASVRVCRDAATRRSLGYAYVNFHRVEDAERAIDTLNFSTIKNRTCRIMWSHRDPTLRRSGTGNIFINNLAVTIDNKALYDTFSVFGNILSCKVAVNSEGNSLGYGFVHFGSEEAAQAAIENVNGKIIEKLMVQVMPFKSKKERGGPDQQTYTNIYVKNLPDDFGKGELDQLFGKFGVITNSVLAGGDEENKHKGFGFVNFEEPEHAKAAVEGVNNMELRGKKLVVCRAQKKAEREKELRDQFERLKLERQKKYAGVNLYIKNLTDDIDDDTLRGEFSKFGDITSAKVMMDPSTSKSRGFGFICFSSPEEATKAVTDMNGKMVKGKPLYVALAQRKDQRRAQLEQQYAQRVNKMAPGGMYPPQTPMFYPQNIPQRVMYPQQMAAMPRRWNGPQAPGVGMMHPGMYGMGMGPQVNGRVMGRGVGPNNRQRNQGQNGKQGSQQQKRGTGRGGQGFKYTAQARNNPMANNANNNNNHPNNNMASVNNAANPALQMNQRPLTGEELAQLNEEQQKQVIGERLFPLIQHTEPMLAGKVTGMLLEMDNGELLHLLESSEARLEKINEALQVLHQHEKDGDAQ